MPRIDVSDQRLIVPRALKQAYDATPVPLASSAAQVSGADREPALVLLDGDDVVLIGPRGTQRWPVVEIERVDGVRILTRDGAEIGISGWWYSAQAQRFRAALRARIGQPAPLEGTDSTPPPAFVPPSASKDGLARVVAVLSAVVLGGALIAFMGLEGLGDKAGTVGIPALVAALLALPLLICGIRLTTSGNPRQVALGIVGILLGLGGALEIVLAIIVVVALRSCPADCV